jgi:uncharacterized protein (TIGR02246 family)
MGATKDLVARSVETWNRHDREGFAGNFTSDAKLTAPGGVGGSGHEIAKQFYDIWHGGFPECEVKPVTIAEDGESAMLEGVFEGTHNGPLNAPAGTIEATGKAASIPFVIAYKVTDGKFAVFNLYFDQLALLEQLGALPTA